jgi:hypothetical protein
VSSGCLRRDEAPTDVAVVVSRGTRAAALARQASRCAQVTVVISSAVDHEALPSGTPLKGDAGRLLLGPGSGLWTPSLRVGIHAPVPSSRGDRFCLLVTQSCLAAEWILLAAAERGLPVAAAVSTGCDAPDTWADVVRAVLALSPRPLLLLALHRTAEFSDFFRFAARAPCAALMLAGDAASLARVPGPRDMWPPSAESIARSFGVPVVHSPDALVEAASLLECGIRPRVGRALALATSPEAAALLGEGIARSGLRTAPLDRGALAGLARPRGRVLWVRGPADPARVGQKIAARAPCDCLVLGQGRGGRALVFGVSSPARGRIPPAHEGDQATLDALAALLSVVPPDPGPAAPGLPRGSTKRAELLLDGWPAELGEVETKILLAAHGLGAPPERMVSSASRAARAARELGFPVAVKATGPSLTDRRSWGAARLPLDTASAARQAFRDVLQACARRDPSPLLDGVLVSRVVPLPWVLDCTVLWPAELSPAVIAARRRADQPSPESQVVLPCPLGAKSGRWAAATLLAHPGWADPPARAVALLGDFLGRLALLGATLAHRMRWIRLDTVSPPLGSVPPLVISARGLQA